MCGFYPTPLPSHTGSGEFGSITLLFDSENLPKDYNSLEWQEKLSRSLRDFIVSKYRLSDPLLVEVESVFVLAEQDSRKRSSHEFLAVNVNILPVDYTKQDIESAIQVRENQTTYDS